MSGIIVVRGPGSFTAVRTGIIIANTLAKLNSIPIRGIVVSHLLTTPEVLRSVATLGTNKTTITFNVNRLNVQGNEPTSF